MTTTFLLIRHAEHDLLGTVLAGRMPGVHLNEAGRRRAELLARRLAAVPLAAVQSSPLERARETAAPIAAAAARDCEAVEALTEIDFGAWSGQGFDRLAADPRWRVWNSARGRARAADGEDMRQVQARVLGHIERMCAAHPQGCVAMVSHGDVIKAALLYVLGASLDAIGRIEIDPASISTIVVGDWGGKVLGLNHRLAEGV